MKIKIYEEFRCIIFTWYRVLLFQKYFIVVCHFFICYFTYKECFKIEEMLIIFGVVVIGYKLSHSDTKCCRYIYFFYFQYLIFDFILLSLVSLIG